MTVDPTSSSAEPALSEDDQQALADVRRKLSRIALVSGLIMGLGFATVFGVIGYRMMRGGDSETPKSALPAAVSVPAGAKLLATALDGDRMTLTLDIDGRQSVLVIDVATGAEIGRIRIEPGAAD